jgi:exonuclease VII small subunit
MISAHEATHNVQPAALSTNGASSTPAYSAAQKRLNPIKRQQMEHRREELEEAIQRLEAAVADCESQLLTFVSAAQTAQLTQQLEASRRELQTALSEWETLSTALS